MYKLYVYLFAIIYIVHNTNGSIRDIAEAFFNGLTGGGGPNYYPPSGGYYPPPGGVHFPSGGLHYPPHGGVPGNRPGCPLCDSSVYSYCNHKELHDACCCDGGTGGFSPFQCTFTDCKYLHANSCEEYQLISNCCCIDVRKSLEPFVIMQRRAIN